MPEDFKTRNAHLDWAAIAAAGNVYRDEYEMVDDVLLWHTAQHSLAALETAVQTELTRLQDY